MIAPNPYTILTPNTGILDATQQNAIQLGSTDQVTNAFSKTGEGTIAIFLYINPLQRTPVLSTPDKSQQEDHITLFKLSNIYNETKLSLISKTPGQGQSELTTELHITTQSGKVETAKFKPLPIQKWIYLTISRRGRRYNIFYNDEQVSSFRTDDYPQMDTVRWIPGDSVSGMTGTFAYPLLSNKESTVQDIKQRLRKFADTRYKPILPKPSITTAFSSSTWKGCPSGLFCFSSDSAPSNALDAWSSPFA